ncbi:MAG: acetyl-CoA carboxylase biotin carboxylase subunit family protein, partial [Thermoplasmata archaeon]
ALVREVGLPVVVHTHSSSGLSAMTCLAVTEAGATAFDTALSPFSGGTSQPPTETMVGALRGGPHDPRLDLGALADLAEYFRGVLDHYLPLLNLRSLQTDPAILLHQVPGGMLSNLLGQLAEQGAAARLGEVLEEVPRVRADLGYPPLVTPTSQIVGVQAVVNVLTGTRYQQITREVQDYVRGLYGTPPAPLDADLRRKVLGEELPIRGRPADLLAPEFARALTEVRAFVPAADEAEALSYAMFPSVFKAYRRAADLGLTPAILSAAAVGIATVLRTPAVPAAAPAPPRSEAGPSGGVSPWAHEGRVGLGRSGRWIDASRARRR